MGNLQLLPGQGLLFNTDSRSNIYPDFKGQIMTPSGEILNIAGWFKTTKRVDTNYISVRITQLPETDKSADDVTNDQEEQTLKEAPPGGADDHPQ